MTMLERAAIVALALIIAFDLAAAARGVFWQ